AIRRTGMYFHSEPTWLLPRRVRAPQSTVPYTGKVRMQLVAEILRSPFSVSVSTLFTPATPDSDASMPAGAFHTPRSESVRACTPATKPDGGNSRNRPCCNGSEAFTHGK